ncbi:MAG: hypothetical protein AAB478_03600 [Patescibacteria group bacterium]
MIKKISIIFFLISYLLPLTSHQVEAAGFDLSVSPPIFQIELTPPAAVKAQKTLTLENTGDDPLLLDVVYKAFRPLGDNGELEYLKDGESVGNDPYILDKVSILADDQAVSTINLPPKTKRDYDLAISIPKDEPPGDYYFSLLFVSQASGELPQSSVSQAAGAVAVNVLLSIGPKTKTTGSIEDFSTSFFQAEGPVPFTVKIKNTSSHFIYPKGQIIITNMFGQNIGKIDLLPVNILSNSTRSLPSKEQFVFAANKNTTNSKQVEQIQRLSTSDQRPLAVWPETFLLGPYTATLTIALSPEGPVYTRSIHFIGIPLYILGGFAIVILLLLAITKRLKHRQQG